YRVRGTFRYEIADRTKWKEGDFKLHSNEVVFTLSEWDEAKQGAWPAGNEAGGCTLSLLADRKKWVRGDRPVSFAAVVTRLKEGRKTYPLVSVIGMTYYSLEVTDAQNKSFVVPQPVALPSSVTPHFRFTQLAVGQSAAERLSWDPAGKNVQRTPDLK